MGPSFIPRFQNKINTKQTFDELTRGDRRLVFWEGRALRDADSWSAEQTSTKDRDCSSRLLVGVSEIKELWTLTSLYSGQEVWPGSHLHLGALLTL